MRSSTVFLGNDDSLAGTMLRPQGLKIVDSSGVALKAYSSRRSGCVWVATDQQALAPLRGLVGAPWGDSRLLVLGPMDTNLRNVLSVLFRVVLSTGTNVKLLPQEDLLEVLTAPNRDDLFVGGFVDEGGDVVVLYRGDLKALVVPLRWFTERVGVASANPKDFEVIDFGQTVRLGDFEAAHDAILYAFDPEFRRRIKASRIQEEQSLGASLRRLRLLKGLRRSDFPEVNEKEIARIERGEVKRPQAKTMALLAQGLGVEPEAIAGY